jgi:hypothetical protein
MCSGDIECAVSLSTDKDHGPITLQVLEVANVISINTSMSSVGRVEATLLDGMYFFVF